VKNLSAGFQKFVSVGAAIRSLPVNIETNL